MEEVRAYMAAHPESELHRRGKMFDVLVCEEGVLKAFSAMLDGSYHHAGFVPPVYEAKGEEKDLLQIFQSAWRQA